jgi:hypothetical protein
VARALSRRRRSLSLLEGCLPSRFLESVARCRRLVIGAVALLVGVHCLGLAQVQLQSFLQLSVDQLLVTVIRGLGVRGLMVQNSLAVLLDAQDDVLVRVLRQRLLSLGALDRVDLRRLGF